MNQQQYLSIQSRVVQLRTSIATSKAKRRLVLRKLCTDLNFKADTWELSKRQDILEGLAISRVAYGSLTAKQKELASKLLNY